MHTRRRDSPEGSAVAGALYRAVCRQHGAVVLILLYTTPPRLTPPAPDAVCGLAQSGDPHCKSADGKMTVPVLCTSATISTKQQDARAEDELKQHARANTTRHTPSVTFNLAVDARALRARDTT